MTTRTIHTIGHGNRAIGAFIGILRRHGIEILVDVRAHPESRRFPWFSMAQLRHALNGADVVYHWAGRHLGGRRAAAPDSAHAALDAALRGYADHMRGAAFKAAIRQLRNLARASNVAVMCAERDPDDCHRRLIADYLHFEGCRVAHVIDERPSVAHRPHPSIRLDAGGLVYDRGAQRSLC